MSLPWPPWIVLLPSPPKMIRPTVEAEASTVLLPSSRLMANRPSVLLVRPTVTVLSTMFLIEPVPVKPESRFTIVTQSKVERDIVLVISTLSP